MTNPHLCSGVFVAADPSYLGVALDQLADADCGGSVTAVGPRTAVLVGASPEAAFHTANTAYGCAIQQLADVVACLPVAEDDSVVRLVIAALVDSGALASISGDVSFHIWADGNPLRVPPVRIPLTEHLRDVLGLDVTMSGSEFTISVCLGKHATVVAVTRSKYLISDWPGGVVRLAKRGRVSKAAMKLEAALKLSGEKCTGIAADLGASPGGWTQALRDQGCVEVHAVDPQPLHDEVCADSSVFEYAQMARQFVHDTPETFDVITCDIKASAQESAKLMVLAAKKLKRNGLVVITLRTSTQSIGAEMELASELLEQHYDRLLFRQTSANRNEVTFVGVKV